MRWFKKIAVVSIGLVGLLLVCQSPGRAQTPPAASEKPDSVRAAEKSSRLPVDVRVRRVILQYETTVSFLMPEGEFNASFEKRFGHFSSLTRARYNFLKGEMGFSFQNIFTKYRIVPQLQVYDKLLFVPIFDRGRLWRREQGILFGGRLLFGLPANAFTNFGYYRFSYPSTVNVQQLESQAYTSISQSLGAEVDSVRFWGLVSSGTVEIQLDRAFPFMGSRLNFWQLQLKSRGKTTNHRFSVEGRLHWVSLLKGEKPPPCYLGGPNQLSAYERNEFSGVNLLYVGLLTNFHIYKKHLTVMKDFGLYEIKFGIHTEVGQAGGDRQMRDFRSYHGSLGLGFSAVSAYKKMRAFEIFFFIYKKLQSDPDLKYYFGFRL
ncbi:MAG: hypothetical protein Q9P14_04785 [candidate division KSB1 bacterium]|nr:hypothetical protein [candidate division KSB1 bacterium]